MIRIYKAILLVLLILPLHKMESKNQFKYELAACAIFKNDAPYLKEWIEFHLLVGIQHFYLYNNLSTDDYKKVLTPYMKKKQVTLIEWPYEYQTLDQWRVIQCSAYADVLRKTKNTVRWLALIDTDEFLFPVEKDNLIDFLSDYQQFGGVGANWQVYGTSNVSKIPQDKLLIETLLLKSNIGYERNRLVKSIVQPLRVNCCVSAHFCQYKEGYGHVNENKIPFQGAITPEVSINKIRINHYWTRDEEYFYHFKVNRLWAGDAADKIDQLNFINKEMDDGAIQRFVPDLRERMFR